MVVVEHSRRTYARTREEVEREIEEMMNWRKKEEPQPKSLALSPDEQKLYDELVAVGLLPEQAQELMKHFDALRIRRQLAWLPPRAAKNPAGYLLAAVKDDYAAPRNALRPWMSQSQLMKRTGRNSAALSAALDALVRKNLIECGDAEGEPLLTPQQRRRHRGRVYFALAPNLLLKVASMGQAATPLQPVGDGADSVRRLGNEFTQRISNGWAKASEVAAINYKPKSEVRKAKRTKETEEQKKI